MGEQVTNGLDVVVEGPHEVGSGDLQFLRPLHVHLYRGCGLHGGFDSSVNYRVCLVFFLIKIIHLLPEGLMEKRWTHMSLC